MIQPINSEGHGFVFVYIDEEIGYLFTGIGNVRINRSAYYLKVIPRFKSFI